MPDKSIEHIQRAEAFAKDGRLNDSIREFREAVRIDPDAGPAVRFNFGMVLAKNGLHADAIAQFQISLRTNRGDAASWYNLGLSLEAQGRCAEALATFENFIANAPEKLQEIDQLQGRIADLRRKLDEGDFQPAASPSQPAPAPMRDSPKKDKAEEKKPQPNAKSIPTHILLFGGFAAVVVCICAALSVSILMRPSRVREPKPTSPSASPFDLPAVPGENPRPALSAPPVKPKTTAAPPPMEPAAVPLESAAPRPLRTPQPPPAPPKASPPPARSPRSAKAPAPDMVMLPAGGFQMGSPDDAGGSDEHPRHKVYLDAFLMDTHEVTTAMYGRCVREGGCSEPKTGGYCNWGESGRERHPVNCVDWGQADSFCKWAGKRLPSEAEWEKAARAGSAAKYSFGDDERRLAEFAWYGDNSGRTHPVMQKKANPYGLYDMYGNVWEWAADWYDAQYYQGSPDRNPENQAPAQYRAARGGAWDYGADNLRSASREAYAPGSGYGNVGFRCARNAAP